MSPTKKTVLEKGVCRRIFTQVPILFSYIYGASVKFFDEFCKKVVSKEICI